MISKNNCLQDLLIYNNITYTQLPMVCFLLQTLKQMPIMYWALLKNWGKESSWVLILGRKRILLPSSFIIPTRANDVNQISPVHGHTQGIMSSLIFFVYLFYSRLQSDLVWLSKLMFLFGKAMKFICQKRMDSRGRLPSLWFNWEKPDWLPANYSFLHVNEEAVTHALLPC